MLIYVPNSFYVYNILLVRTVTNTPQYPQHLYDDGHRPYSVSIVLFQFLCHSQRPFGALRYQKVRGTNGGRNRAGMLVSYPRLYITFRPLSTTLWPKCRRGRTWFPDKSTLSDLDDSNTW